MNTDKTQTFKKRRGRPPKKAKEKNNIKELGINKIKLRCALQSLQNEYIIAYQNAIGHSIKGDFGITTRNFRGIAGKRKVPITVVVQTFPGGKGQMVKITVMRDDGRHAATETMTGDKFKRLMKDPNGFWLYPRRPF